MVHSATLSQTTSGISVVSYPMDSGASFIMIDTQNDNKRSSLNKTRGLEFLPPSKSIFHSQKMNSSSKCGYAAAGLGNQEETASSSL